MTIAIGQLAPTALSIQTRRITSTARSSCLCVLSPRSLFLSPAQGRSPGISSHCIIYVERRDCSSVYISIGAKQTSTSTSPHAAKYETHSLVSPSRVASISSVFKLRPSRSLNFTLSIQIVSSHLVFFYHLCRCCYFVGFASIYDFSSLYLNRRPVILCRHLPVSHVSIVIDYRFRYDECYIRPTHNSNRLKSVTWWFLCARFYSGVFVSFFLLLLLYN